MSHQLAYLDPGFGIWIKAFEDYIETFTGNCFFDLDWDLVLAFLDILLDLMIVGPFKRQLPTKHTKEYHSNSPNIHPAIKLKIPLSNPIANRIKKALRGHIAQTPSIQILLGKPAHHARNAKIDNLNLLLFRVDQHDILELQIAMD